MARAAKALVAPVPLLRRFDINQAQEWYDAYEQWQKGGMDDWPGARLDDAVEHIGTLLAALKGAAPKPEPPAGSPLV